MFIGSNVFTVKSAISAGLGIACLEHRTLPVDCEVVPKNADLPPLPATEFVLEATSSARKQDAKMMEALIEYFQNQKG